MMSDKEKIENHLRKVERAAQHFKNESEHYRVRWDSLQKWLLASFVSVNGGSLLALMGYDGVDPRSKFFAACWFFAGCAAAILFAILVANILWSLFVGSYKLHMILRDLSEDISKFDDHDDASFLRQKDLYAAINYLMYLPFICFLIGGLIVAEGLQ